jgi:hypothetical protein
MIGSSEVIRYRLFNMTALWHSLLLKPLNNSSALGQFVLNLKFINGEDLFVCFVRFERTV